VDTVDITALKAHYDELRALESALDRLRNDEKPLVSGLLEQFKNIAQELDEVVESLPLDARMTADSDRQSARARVTYSMVLAAMTVGQVQGVLQKLSTAASGILQRAITWLLSHLFNALNTIQTHLQIQSWSVQATVGFPWGVNVALTITFG
jgi:hypothetical protein